MERPLSTSGPFRRARLPVRFRAAATAPFFWFDRVTAQMPNPIDLLIVDDDTDYRGLLVRRFKRREYQVHEACDGVEALELAHRRQFDVAIVDMTMPGMTGLDVLEKLKALQPECEVIMHTGQASIETAVKAMKIGAYDYLVKPCPMVECEALVEKAVERRQLAKENVQLKELLQRRPPEPEMIGESAAIKEVWRLIERAGPTDKAILIQGESGTGKELVARALHRRSSRADKQLVAINCAALPETLLESELFGHEKGAFTGAMERSAGCFEQAHGGTLFLDEIGEMPASTQPKLLRVLEDLRVRRLGGKHEIAVDARVLAATSQELGTHLREELYYRLSVFQIALPPLRDHKEDIPPIVEVMLRNLNKKYGARVTGVDDEVQNLFQRYDWPGNVRELRNVLERAAILAGDRSG